MSHVETCEKETKLDFISHCTEAISMCIKDYLYDLGEGNEFFKQDIRTKNYKEKTEFSQSKTTKTKYLMKATINR